MQAMLDMEKRAYRKNLSCDGLIYLGFEEHQIRLINLSLTGLLAELKPNANLNGVKDIFQSLQVSPIVDIYLPDIRVAGEAEVVRAESAEHGIQIALEFRNLSYDVDNLLYNRRAYRKNMTAPGQIIINDVVHAFNTENVSVDGIMAHIQGRVSVELGAVVHFSFKHLELQGEAEVMWLEEGPHSTLLGLKYIHLERDDIPGVPRFVRDEKTSD
ncbi:PilZ domain-containing protein [Methylomonas rapida]|jgi:PilZ domain.|uniref:PilZ domain-containing protein n=1 Tax=Methylomonas rapida TaxID=2963939 RepID=A0ABY7GHC9_9GAMM|nr:PilZ domain-containing protein [Methylomonas rapida]WAR44662.1 PilZ domain-containing protein [Methylomonas rapida]